MGLDWYQIPAGAWYAHPAGVFAQVHSYDHRDGTYWVATLTGPEIGEVELGYDHCTWHDAEQAKNAAEDYLAEITSSR